MNNSHTDAQKRHDFFFLFDVTDGNPNGDPDNDNLPRTDPETGQGLVTDVCLKRKMRDYVSNTKGGESKYKIYVEHRAYLADSKKRAFEALGIPKGDDKRIDEAREWMCQNFYDIRTFGGVLVGKKGEGYNCGQVRGPIQLTFSRSIDRVFAYDVSITRVALENAGDKPRASDDEHATTGTMGRKALLPYGLYMGYGFYSPMLARGTGFNDADLALFWEAMQGMFENDHSASRGSMVMHEVGIYSHDKPMGNAPSHKLFQRVSVSLEKAETPRRYGDYAVLFPPEGEMSDFPGVSFKRLIG
jgi:CRISPR-associated protein Csd2